MRTLLQIVISICHRVKRMQTTEDMELIMAIVLIWLAVVVGALVVAFLRA
jgi:hypothetical protein